MNKLLLLSVLFSANLCAAPVNINSADAETISAALTGISIKTAEAIVAERVQHGYFKSDADLKHISGMDEKIIALNKADILFSNPETHVTKTNPPTGRYHPRTRERHGHTRERPGS